MTVESNKNTALVLNMSVGWQHLIFVKVVNLIKVLQCKIKCQEKAASGNKKHLSPLSGVMTK